MERNGEIVRKTRTKPITKEGGKSPQTTRYGALFTKNELKANHLLP